MTKSASTSAPGWLPESLRPWLHWRRKRFWLLVTLAAYTLVGFLLVPWIAKRTVVDTFAQTERTARIAELQVNPFLLTVNLEGFELDDRDGAPLLTLDRLFVDLQTRSLFHWAWTFKDVLVDGLHPREERFQGTDTRFTRLLADLAANGEAPEAEAPASPPPVIIDTLRIRNTRLTVTDQPTGGLVAEIGPIDVAMEDLRTQAQHEGRQSVSIRWHDTDQIEWEGSLQLVPFESRGILSVTGTNLDSAREYLDYHLPFALAVDGLAARLRYTFSLEEGAPSLRISDAEVSLDGLALTPDGTDTPVLTLASLGAENGSLDLPSRAAALDALRLTGLAVNAHRRPDGSLNLLDLLPASPAGDGPVEPSAPWRLSLARFALENGSLDLEDRAHQPPAVLGVRDLTLGVEAIDLAPGTRMPFDLSGRLESGGEVSATGTARAFPAPEAEAELSVDALAIAVAQPYLTPLLRVRLDGGLLSLDGSLVHGPEQALALDGALELSGLDVRDVRRDERLAAWDRLQLERFEVDLAANRVETSVLDVDGLYGRVHIAEDRSTNIGDLLVQRETDSANASAPPAPLPDVTVGGIGLAGAALDFSDFSLPLPFETSIRDLEGELSTLSTTSSEAAAVSLEGQVNEYGLARIQGSVNTLDPTRDTDITLTFRNLEIARLTPYTVQFAGYAIEEGRLDMDLGYRLDDRKLVGDNNIVIREMQLGEKVDHPDAGSLPLGLAVALLKDADGVIDVDVPVEGDLDNPEFRIGSVIWRAIGNLITRAVTAPFRLLGSLVGVDSEDFGVLAFQPGLADLSPPDREQLIKLGEAMRQRPQLALEVGGSWAPSLDGPALKAEAVAGDVSTWLTEHPVEDELSMAGQRRALEALFISAFPDLPLDSVQADHRAPPADNPEAEPLLDQTAYLASLRNRLEANRALPEDAFIELAEARADAVITTLRASQPDAELAVRRSDPQAVDAAEDGTVPLELSVTAEG